jgi:two-component system, NtrC family, response regulator AtoC
MAHRGTLFLDEISELEPGLQAKLLQLLQDGQFCRIGAQEDKRVEVRVVCATNRALEHEISSGTFRADLFYRINVVNLRLPQLRERSQDIPMLVDYFLKLYNEKYNCRAQMPSNHTIALLERYHWPGNIRELENLIKRYVILGSEETIGSELLSHREERFDPEIPNTDAPIALKKVTRQAVRELERRIIFKVLQANNWNRKKAARSLNISYRALLYKIRDAGLGSMGSSKNADSPTSAD